MFYAFQPGDAAQHICRMFFRVLGYQPIVYAKRPRSLLWLSQADWCPHRDPRQIIGGRHFQLSRKLLRGRALWRSWYGQAPRSFAATMARSQPLALRCLASVR